MTLESVFYVMGIVFMALMFILLTILVVAVLVIRAKINAIHRHIEDKFEHIVSLVESGSKIVAGVRSVTNKHK